MKNVGTCICEETMANVNERVWTKLNEALLVLKLRNHNDAL